MAFTYNFPVSTTLRNLADPVLAIDAATKQYVDDTVANTIVANTVIVPAIGFTATATANNQQFTDPLLENYANLGNDYFGVFYNGSLLPPTEYSLTGNVLTINTYISSGDSINITPGVANVTGGTYVSYSAGAIEIPALYFVAPTTANNQQFTHTQLVNYQSTANRATVYYNGSLIENTDYTIENQTLTVNIPLQAGDTIDVARSLRVANAVQIPQIVFPVTANSNVFSNSFLTLYPSKDQMTVFYNGSVLENTQYSLVGGTLTLGIPVNDGNTVVVSTAAVSDSDIYEIGQGVSISYMNFGAHWSPTGLFGTANAGKCQITTSPTGIIAANDIVRVSPSPGEYDQFIITEIAGAGGVWTLTTVPEYTSTASLELSKYIPTISQETAEFVNDIVLGNGISGSSNAISGVFTLDTVDRTIPYIHFDVTANGNNQTFTNPYILGYTNTTQMSVYRNGVLVLPTDYQISGVNITFNVDLQTDDNIDITQGSIYAGNINVVDSGFYSNVVTVAANVVLTGVEQVVLLSGANNVITLPPAAESIIGKTLIMKDIAGNSRVTAPVTIAASANNTIDGSSSFQIKQAYNSVTLLCTTSDSWGII